MFLLDFTCLCSYVFKTLFAVPLGVIFLIIAPKALATISFSLANPQTSGDEVTIDVSISGLASSSCPNITCYLQAAFTPQGKTKYLGLTKNHIGDWYEYNGSPDPSYIKSTFFAFQPASGSWSGKLTIRPNPQDPDYEGPGTYSINAWRYTGNSSNYSGASDNILTTQLTVSLPSPTPSPSPTPDPSPTTSSSPAPTPAKSPSPTPAPSIQKSPLPSPKSSPEVLGETEGQSTPSATTSSSPSPSDSPQNQPDSKVKIAGLLTGSGLVLIGISFGLYLWYSKRLAKSAGTKDHQDDGPREIR